MTTDVIEGEIVGTAIVQHESTALFGTTEPREIVARATDTANALKDVINQQGLITNIQGKEYVQVGGWTLLGSMLGVFPVNVWTRELPNGWEARVEARTLSGAVVGAAEAQCCRDEKMWEKRDGYALRSMAQTRATSKALRMPLGFVVTLAGFESTPAEEMTFSRDDEPRTTRTFHPKPGLRAPAGPSPECPSHGKSMKYVVGGVSKASGKPYDAFWACQTKTCAEGHNGKAWSIFANVWQQMVQVEGNTEPGVTVEQADDLPNE